MWNLSYWALKNINWKLEEPNGTSRRVRSQLLQTIALKGQDYPTQSGSRRFDQEPQMMDMEFDAFYAGFQSCCGSSFLCYSLFFPSLEWEWLFWAIVCYKYAFLHYLMSAHSYEITLSLRAVFKLGLLNNARTTQIWEAFKDRLNAFWLTTWTRNIRSQRNDIMI